MSLQKIQMAPETLENLFRDKLVVLEAPGAANTPLPQKPVAVNVTDRPAIRFLGNNLKKIGILVNFPKDVFLPDQHLQFLTKILEACKLNLGDVAILNHATQPVDIKELKSLWQPSFLMLFDVDPNTIGLPIQFPEFKPQSFDSVTFLCFPPLEQLNQDTEEGKLLKSKLWVCLRKLFNI